MAVTRKIVEVHLSTISIGDSISCNDGFERTIGKNIFEKSLQLSKYVVYLYQISN